MTGRSAADAASGLRPCGAEPQDASQAKPLVPNAAHVAFVRQAYSDGFYDCAAHYTDDPDSKAFGEMAEQAWGDYAESQLGVCGTPPFGWFCTRKPGHDGPCAASAIEARSDAAPQSDAAEGESAVAKPDAQTPTVSQ